VTAAGPREGIVEIWLELDPIDIAFVKFVFESYEGIAVVRTGDQKRAIIVLIVSADFAGDARRILDDLARTVRWRELPAPEASRRRRGALPGDDVRDQDAEPVQHEQRRREQ
jgi:hypothetical protein